MNDTITLPDRDRDHERALGIVFDISPAQASVLSCLSRSLVATGDQLLEYTGAKSHIKVVVSRVREALRLYNIDVKSKHGVGYWIEPEGREEIKDLVAKFMDGK